MATDPSARNHSSGSRPSAGGERPAESAIRASVEALLDRHEGDLIRYGLSLCGDRDLAEDAVQESFIALVAELRRGVVIDEPAAWLTRVVRNRTRDSQRKEERVHRREAAVATLDRGGATPDLLEIDEERGAVTQLLAELDPVIREVIELSVIAGKSYREVATITGTSLGTVANRVHQGLRSIAAGLRAAGVIEGGAR